MSIRKITIAAVAGITVIMLAVIASNSDLQQRDAQIGEKASQPVRNTTTNASSTAPKPAESENSGGNIDLVRPPFLE